MRFRSPFARITEADIESVEAWQSDIRKPKLVIGGLVLLLVIACLVWVASSVSWSSGRRWSPALLGGPTALQMQNAAGFDPELLVSDGDAVAVTGAEAMTANAAIPVSGLPNPAMPAFPAILDAKDMAAAEDCLTAAIYYEAGFESGEGQRAVAQVVLNRVRHPLYPKNVCGVVLQGFQRSTGCQFSFTCDGAWANPAEPRRYANARAVARAALGGYVDRAVGAATHYHAAYVLPYWAPRLVKVYVSGLHIFYRFPGAFGSAGAMKGRYAGQERIPDERASFRSTEVLPDAELTPVIALPPVDLTPAPPPSVVVTPLEHEGAAHGSQAREVAVPQPESSTAQPEPPRRRPQATFRDDRPLVPPPPVVRRNGW